MTGAWAAGVCYLHPDKASAGTCNECSKNLCVGCLSRYDAFNDPTCQSCASDTISQGRREIRHELILALLIFPLGWRALNRALGGFFLALSIWGWIMFFAIKLAVSLELGVVILPFKLWKLRGQSQRLKAAALEVATSGGT